jgi:hypothetical protein
VNVNIIVLNDIDLQNLKEFLHIEYCLLKSQIQFWTHLLEKKLVVMKIHV